MNAPHTIATVCLLLTLAIRPAECFVIKDGDTIKLTPKAQSTTGQVWTLNANEGKADEPVMIHNRQLIGPVNDKKLAVLNNGKEGVADLVLHYHSDQPIKAFTWQIRQIVAVAGAGNQDSFFVGWTTEKIGGHGQAPINPGLFKPVEALTLTGKFNKTFERPNFSVKDIDSKDVYIFIGRNDLNAKGDKKNEAFEKPACLKNQPYFSRGIRHVFVTGHVFRNPRISISTSVHPLPPKTAKPVFSESTNNPPADRCDTVYCRTCPHAFKLKGKKT